MKKLYLQLLPAFVTRNKEQIKAVKIFFLAFILSCIGYTGFAQVTVTPANDTLVCSRTALTGAAPSCTTLPTSITITETLSADFSLTGPGPGFNQIVLNAPADWQFCTSTLPTVTPVGGDVALGAVSVSFVAGNLQIQFHALGTVTTDQLIITGLQVQPLTPTAATGNIFATGVVGVLGITPGVAGTSFGKLGVIPVPITNPNPGGGIVCVGSCLTSGLVSSPGVLWSSSNPAIASIGALTGIVCGISAGTATITATLSGCFVTYPITVAAAAPPIFGAHNMCAWFDSLVVTNSNFTGVYSASLVTVNNITGTGTGKVYAHAPGIATITYTLPSGCSSTVTLTVNPLPSAILDTPYEVCEGSSILLTSSPGGGTWSSTIPAIGSIDPVSGLFTGVSAGITTVMYTLSTGCAVDTQITVFPRPLPIGGDTTVCDQSTMTVTDATTGGTWSITPTSVATINPATGVVTAVSAGIATVTYTLSTGCFITRDITVNPLPQPIGGPSAVCVGDSIQLTTLTTGGKWISGNTSVATVDSVTGYVLGVTSGFVTIFYVLPTGCVMPHNVTVNPLPTILTGPTALCVDGAGVFTASPGPGTWSSSSTGIATIDPISGVVTAVSGGTTTICYTLSATGCTVCDTLTVNPNPFPITGPDSVCVGDSLILSNASTGGIWVSAVPSNLFIDSFSGHGRGLIASSTPITVTYILAGTGCNVSKTVVVQALPDTIAGPSTVCQGDSIHLTDATPGGYWTSQFPSIATVDFSTGWLHGITAGTTEITYTGPAGCFVRRSITVYPNTPITGPTHVCQYQSILLSNPTPGTWTTTPGHVSLSLSTGDVIVTGLTPGIDTITKTSFSGCTSTHIVIVDPLDTIVGFNQVCVDDSLLLTDATPGGIWSSSDTNIAKVSSVGWVYGISGGGFVVITYTMPASGCFTTKVVSVNSLPFPIVGPDSVCQGTTNNMYTSSTPGVEWTVTNTALATIGITVGDLTAILPGLDTVKVTIPLTGCYVTKEVKINPITPIFSSDSTVCVGSSILLLDLTSGGDWGSIDPPVFGTIDAGGTVTGVTMGVDTFTYTMPLSGCVVRFVVTVNPLPAVIVGPDSVCTGVTVVYTNDTIGGTWSSSNTGVGVIDPVTGSFTALTPGVTIITYTLPTGCFVTKSVTVNLTPAGIVGPGNVCVGRKIVLTNPTPGGVWTNVNPAITVGTLTVADTILGLAVGVDTIIYTLPIGGCSVGKEVTVTPIPVITVTPNPSPLKCKYDPVVLTASGAGTGAGVIYTWSPSYALSSTVGATVIATPTITTTYTVTGSTSFGCDSFTTVIVYVDDSLNNMKIVGKDSICEGTCDLLMASGRAGSYFNWHPIAGLSCTICDTVTACPTVTTTYWAVAIDDLGCKDSVSFTVHVNPLPLISVDPFPAIVCKGKPTQLVATSPNTDDTTNVYTWSPNLFISCDTCYNPIITDTANLVYEVRATTMYGCYDSLDVKVSVLDTNVNWIINDTNICIGGTALLWATSHSVTGNLDIPTFTWIPSTDLNAPFSNITLATPSVTTTYSVAIHENACFDDTLSVTVFVQPYPVITITTNITGNTIVAGTPIQLAANVYNTPVQTYVWYPANTLTCDSCFNPIAIPTVTTRYMVTVTSIYGCTSTDTITLNLFCDNSQIFIPNTFTPNGDGANDRFYVSGKGISRITFMQVLNRWGQVVFEAHNIRPNEAADGWDGTYKGSVVPPDVFVYIVKAECELGSTFTYSGDVSIVK